MADTLRCRALGLRILLCGLAACVVGLTGCTHPTVVVTQASGSAMAPTATAKADGIPFYAKYGVCTQETVWLEPRYTWALTVQADEFPPVTKTLQLSGYAYRQPEVREALSALGVLSGKHAVSAEDGAFCPSSVRETWSEVSGNPEYAVRGVTDDAEGLRSAPPGTLVRVANTATVSTAVDYSRTYYINARTPFIGTGNLDAKLNPDGTLTEGNGQVSDQTWAAVLGALGGMSGFAQTMAGIAAPMMVGATASSALSSDNPPPPPERALHGSVRHEFACEAVPGWPEAKKSVTYTFAVTAEVYRHDHTQQVRLGADGVCAAAKGAGVTDGSFVVSPLVVPSTRGADSAAPSAGPDGHTR